MVTTSARWTSGLSVSTRRGPTGAQPARALWGWLMLLRGVCACHLGECVLRRVSPSLPGD